MPRDRKRLSDPADSIDAVQLAFYASNPANKINRDFGESFAATNTDPPFVPNAHFDAASLRNRLQTRKMTQNPRLNFAASEDGAFELFTGGRGRFDNQRADLYDFAAGRGRTKQNFTADPQFKPMWAELYFNSPTLETTVSNPMPRLKNPDPKNNIMNRAEAAAQDEYDRNFTVAQLIGKGQTGKEEDVEEKEKDDKQTLENKTA